MEACRVPVLACRSSTWRVPVSAIAWRHDEQWEDTGVTCQDFTDNLLVWPRRTTIDRKLVVRVDGLNREFRISRRGQIGLAVASVLAIGLLAASGAGLVVQQRLLAERADEIARRAAVEAQLSSEVRSTRDRLVALAEAAEVERNRVRAKVERIGSAYEIRQATLGDDYQVHLDETKKSAQMRLAAKDTALKAALADGERLTRERDDLRQRAQRLELRLTDLGEAQRSVIDRLIERTLVDIEALEETVALTELDLAALMDQSVRESENQGGSFVPLDFEIESHPVIRFQSQLQLLDLQLDRWDSLNKAVRQIPLAAPLDEYRLTSKFGARKDPVNGKKARHDGLDMGASWRAPVLSPAPGTVIFTGWRGHYGRIVEIDHGNGITTLYGHLNKILVKKGQKVGYRDRLGLLGSSGRTTGPHVHYEIRVNGRLSDPLNFLKAGRHVFKG